MSAVIAYRNEPHQKFCQAVLASGEQIVVRIDETGLTIERLMNDKAPGKVLFRADAERATSIALALTRAGKAEADKVLDILVAVATTLGSAERIKAAFQAASRAAR
ncbi:MAG: hypothetical protein JNM30_19020 [Rhodospirillales bacterium]|nr:hypothetical protein [Rhodospirillales bacterium]